MELKGKAETEKDRVQPKSGFGIGLQKCINVSVLASWLHAKIDYTNIQIYLHLMAFHITYNFVPSFKFQNYILQHCRNVTTTPITAMGCRQCLPQLKGKHCRKPHCRNGVVDTFGH